MEYLYDGSFEGFLSCVYAHAYIEPAENIFAESARGAQQLSLARRLAIRTDVSHADRVANAIERKISRASLRRCYRAFLCAEEGREMDILRYIFAGFKQGAAIDALHGDPVVRRMDVLNHKVSWEQDRFLGILRFGVVTDAGGREILYAPYEPVCDITQLMMPHFLNRYRREPFVVHDVGREKAAFADGGRWVMSPLPKSFAPQYTPDEKEYQALWRGYFSAAGIRERTNPKLQKQFIPTRYWSRLTEME